MTMNEIEVRNYAVAKCKEYPELTEDIYGMYDLFLMEVEDGSSIAHEAELFYTDLDAMIAELENRYKTNTIANR